MAEMRGGIGGYGGVTTMNQDQRLGRYYPHLALSLFPDYKTGITTVYCYKCEMRWHHPVGDVQNVPAECRRAT